jgi:hypothetical protein
MTNPTRSGNVDATPPSSANVIGDLPNTDACEPIFQNPRRIVARH